MERWEDHLPECVSPPSGAHEEKWDNSPDVVRRIGAVAPVSSFWVWSKNSSASAEVDGWQ
jgi:hypothetical protein